MAKIWEMKEGVVSSILVSTQESKKVVVPLLKRVSLLETKELMTALDVVEKYLDFKNAKAYDKDISNSKNFVVIESIVGTTEDDITNNDDINTIDTIKTVDDDTTHNKRGPRGKYERLDIDSIIRKLKNEISNDCEFTIRDVSNILNIPERRVQYITNLMINSNIIKRTKHGRGRTLSTYTFINDKFDEKNKENIKYMQNLLG
jgi:predicted transcriptional regulator